MKNFTIAELMDFQKQLYEKNKDRWSARVPENAKDSLLWSIDEMGEVIAIIKKKGIEAVMENPHVRRHYVEECCDVLMYWLDMLSCLHISAEEFCEQYEEKFKRNMERSWSENETMYEE